MLGEKVSILGTFSPNSCFRIPFIAHAAATASCARVDLDGFLERTASGDGFGRDRAGGWAANDSLHDARARLKRSSQ